MMRFATFALLSAAATSSFAQVFYGLDVNPNGQVPLVSRPNHDQAKANFLAAAGAVGTLDFEGVPNGALNQSFNFAGVNGQFVSNSGSGVTRSFVTEGTLFETFAFSGTKYYMVHTDPGVAAFTLTFDRPVFSLGFSMSDEADWLGVGNNPAHVLEVDGTSYSMTNGTNTNAIRTGSASFFGLVSQTGFTSVRFLYPSNGVGSGEGSDAVGIDDIMVGAVPEPTTMLALVAGGIGWVLRRRRG